MPMYTHTVLFLVKNFKSSVSCISIKRKVKEQKQKTPHLRNRLFSFIWLNNRLHCLVTRLCLTLWDSMDCSPPGSSVHEISQGRILAWVAIPPPGDLPKLGIECTSASPELGGRFFTLSHLGSQGSSCKWPVNNSCLMGIQVPSQESFWPQKLCGVLPRGILWGLASVEPPVLLRIPRRRLLFEEQGLGWSRVCSRFRPAEP